MEETSSRPRAQIEAKYNASIASCEGEARRRKREIQQEVTATERQWKAQLNSDHYDDITKILRKNLQERLDDVDKECKTRTDSLEKEKNREIRKHCVAPHSPEPTEHAESRGNSIPPNCDAQPSMHETKSGGKIDSRRIHPTVASGNKRKAEGNSENQTKRPHVRAPSTSEGADKRTPAHTPQSGSEPLTGRTVTFNEVSTNPEHQKDTIVEFPADSGHFYVLYCQEHKVHFTRNPAQGAAKHLNGISHGFTSRNRTLAVKALGYHIIDCNKDLATQHNRAVDEAYANGYKPLRVRDRKREGSHKWQGITNAKPYNVYCALWTQTRKIYPVMILGWDSQYEAGLGHLMLSETGLLDLIERPDCYVYDQGKIVNWAPGFEDGGPKVRGRVFPVRWFDGQASNGWVDARHLRDFATHEFDREQAEYFAQAHSWIQRMQKNKEPNDEQSSKQEPTATESVPTAPRDLPISTSRHTGPKSEAGRRVTDPPGSDSNDTTDASDDNDADDEDDELRRLAERGGDASSDEDYQDTQAEATGSPPQQYTEAYRKAFYDLRPSRTSTCGTHQEVTARTKATEKSLEPLGQMQAVGRLSQKAPHKLATVSCPPNPQTYIACKSRPEGYVQAQSLSANPITKPTSLPPIMAESSTRASGTHLGNSATASVIPGSAVHGQKATNHPDSQRETTANVREKSNPVTPATNPVAQQPRNTEPEQSPPVTQPHISHRDPTPKMLRGILDFSAGKPLFEISQYVDGATRWARTNPGDACTQLFCSRDGKCLVSKDGPVDVKIDRGLFSKSIRNHDEEMNGNGDITLVYRDATTPAMRLVFDRGEGSNMALGKHQVRWFMHWFQDPRFKKSGFD